MIDVFQLDIFLIDEFHMALLYIDFEADLMKILLNMVFVAGDIFHDQKEVFVLLILYILGLIEILSELL